MISGAIVFLFVTCFKTSFHTSALIKINPMVENERNGDACWQSYRKYGCTSKRR